PKVAVLTSPSFGPAELARSLSGLGRRLVVAEDLGSPGERVVEGTAGEIAAGSWRDPNVVAVFDVSRAVGAAAARLWPGRQSPELWGLPEEEFFHRGGMITKAEVRALALARLGPGVGDLIWDVGAGSGSVAVDCARHGAAAIAVEADGCACRFIEANAARHQVFVEVVHGEAPEALDPLPDPDAAFVGGTGGRFEEVVKTVASRVRRGAVVALAAVERVAQAAALLESGALETEAVLVQAARLKPLGHAHRLEPINPVFLVSGRRS
ncbi:MAG: precorrin-6Y C5,15-methyltransferase (decarboxylating) subunit CbiT, partial [Acidimicrobiales bacterium]